MGQTDRLAWTEVPPKSSHASTSRCAQKRQSFGMHWWQTEACKEAMRLFAVELRAGGLHRAPVHAEQGRELAPQILDGALRLVSGVAIRAGWVSREALATAGRVQRRHDRDAAPEGVS